jgi:hypothetical protein
MAEVRLYKLKAALLIATLAIGAPPVFAHTARSVLDAAGNRATFTGLARVTCLAGSPNPTMLVARIRDNSDSIHGLMVNLQLLKGNTALNISDEISGDAAYSSYIALTGGPGEYVMMINKTAAGVRDFDIEWHCIAGDGAHTETDTAVLQFQ